MDALINIREASFGYRKKSRDFFVLKNISCSFRAGEFVGIVGINGSGKSTLFRSIAGLQPTLEGVIEIEGTRLKEISLENLSKKISISLTEKIQGFNLTTFDLVSAGQIPFTNSFHQLKNENLEIINQSIEICGLKDFSNLPLNELSDGLFQKSLIAKSLAQQTPVLLLDEPSAYLDYVSRYEFFKMLRDLAEKKNKCILASSHDLDLVLRYCHSILILDEGNAEQINTSDAIQNKSFKKLSGGYI